MSWIYISSDTLRYALHFSGNIFHLNEKLTMEIEDKESTCREVAVELDKNLIESAVGWFEGCVAAKNPQLRVALVWAVPGRGNTHWNYITTCDPAIKWHYNASKFRVVWENWFTSKFTVRLCWLLNKSITLKTSLSENSKNDDLTD